MCKGPLSEVIVPIDKITRKIKGYGIVTYVIPEHAIKAFNELDGTIFHGRMLHLLPGKSKESDEISVYFLQICDQLSTIDDDKKLFFM